MDSIKFYKMQKDQVIHSNKFNERTKPLYNVALISHVLGVYQANMANPNKFLEQCHIMINQNNMSFGEYLGIAQNIIIDENSMNKIVNKAMQSMENLLKNTKINNKDGSYFIADNVSAERLNQTRYEIGNWIIQQLELDSTSLNNQTFTNVVFNTRNNVEFDKSITLDHCEVINGNVKFYNGLVTASGTKSKLYCMSPCSYGIVKFGAVGHVEGGAYLEACEGGIAYTDDIESSITIMNGGLGKVTVGDGFAYLADSGGIIEIIASGGVAATHLLGAINNIRDLTADGSGVIHLMN